MSRSSDLCLTCLVQELVYIIQITNKQTQVVPQTRGLDSVRLIEGSASNEELILASHSSEAVPQKRDLDECHTHQRQCLERGTQFGVLFIKLRECLEHRAQFIAMLIRGSALSRGLVWCRAHKRKCLGGVTQMVEVLSFVTQSLNFFFQSKCEFTLFAIVHTSFCSYQFVGPLSIAYIVINAIKKLIP